MAGNFVLIERDAENQAINLRVVDSSGAEVAAYGAVKMQLADLAGTNKEAKFRPMIICEGGVEKTTYVLCTEPE